MASFIEIPPLSTGISCHVKYLLSDGQRTDGRPKSCCWRRHKI